MRRSIKYSLLLLLLSSVFLLCPSGTRVSAFNKCQVPPMVGFAAKPNVLLVLDYSGSMQFSAYPDFASNYASYFDSSSAYSKVAYGNPVQTLGTYDPSTRDYYGMFESDKFYKYNADATAKAFELNDSCTATEGTITGSASGNTGGTQITFTASGITLVVNDAVRISGLDSHTIMNGRVYQVLSVSGSTFTVTAKWNGTADTTGKVTKKTVVGTCTSCSASDCMSGDLLNWATTTRIDAALKALTGGRATCTTDECRLRAQGAKRIIMDSSLANALFFVRPGEEGHPWHYRKGSYLDKDMYLTISNYSVPSAALSNTLKFLKPSGSCDAAKPSGYNSCSTSTAANAHVWRFAVTSANTPVRIDMECLSESDRNDDTSSRDPYLFLYSSGTGTWGVAGSTVVRPADASLIARNDDREAYSSTTTYYDKNATISTTLGVGTYYVIATTSAEVDTINYSLNSNVDLTRLVASGANLVPDASQGTTRVSNIGTLFDARLSINVPVESRSGVIQDSFDKVRFGLMWFNNAATDNEGKIVVGCHNAESSTGLSTLVSAFDSLIPYYGTPTGEAFEEARYYLKQQSLSGYADNSAFISPGTTIDPYYSALAPSNFLCCRKSYVLLVSDGEWNGSVDPVTPTRLMHTEDLRSTCPGGTTECCGSTQAKQTADVYTIWAFSSETSGQQAMKTTAMFGGFKDVDGCGTTDYPYPYTSSTVPSDSRDVVWPLSGYCDTATSGTYSKKCCGEWDIVWDKDTEGDNLLKGVPDNYYEASDGSDLAAAITKILEGVLTGNAAAGAVATISQEVRGQDVILRGVFQVSDINVQDKYLWYGHLESYSPFYINGEWKYAFEFCCNAGQLCMDMPGATGSCTDACPSATHCWDAAQYLVPANRKIYAWKDADGDGIVDSGEFKAFSPAAGDSDSTIASNFVSALSLTAREDCDSDGSYTNDTDDASALIQWVRGVSTLEGSCYRNRTDTTLNRWLLGDIVYSTPVIVGTPTVGAVSQNDPDVDAFYTYRNAEIAKLSGAPSGVSTTSPSLSEVIKRMVYVGANDGMVHAFVLAVWDWRSSTWVYERNSSDPYAKHVGEELWSYIPSNLLSELKAVADPSYGNTGCKHRAMVDLSPRSYYVFIDPDGTGTQTAQWRNVLLGGERGGGDVYFAIDITDPNNPRLIWEFSVLKNLLRYLACPWTWDGSASLGRVSGRTYYCSSTNHPTYGNVYTTYCSKCCPTTASGWTTNCNTLTTKCLSDHSKHCCVCTTPGVSGYIQTGFKTIYSAVNMLPVSWSRPFVGRLNLPASSSVAFYTGDPVSGSPTGVFAGGNKHIVFVGGGFRLFDTDLTSLGVTSDDLAILREPHFFAIDMETGVNLFRYVWPYIRQNMSGYSTLFPAITIGTNNIPYAMSDPLALDYWNNTCTGSGCTGTVGDDGFIDHIYVGDLTGILYGFKFNFHPNATNMGMLVDLWLTKGIYQPTSTSDSEYSTNWSLYRQLTHPITVQPTASLDGSDTNYVRVIFGTGKYDDVVGAQDDKTDPARMALYNLKDYLELPDLSVSTGYGGEIVSGSGLWVRLNPRCGATDPTSRRSKLYSNADSYKCSWIKTSGTYIGDHDCCEKTDASCTSPCWDCVYDLLLPDPAQALNPEGARLMDPGERILGKALIAGGLVFVTTYVPSRDACDYLGNSFLYVFDYMCQPFPVGFDPIPDPAVQRANFYSGTASTQMYGVRVEVGKGLPSEPVLDSTGEHVIIQTSNADIHRIAVELLKKPFQVKGWKEE